MPTLSELRSILRANSRLEHLVILGWSLRMDPTLESEREQNDLQMIDLPRLETLEIGFVNVTHGISLLLLFAFPNLRALAVEFGIQPCEHQDFLRLFDHLMEMSTTERVSFSSLWELSLRCTHAEDTSIRILFGQLCAVTSLCLDRVDATAIVAICSTLHACHRLEKLTLKDMGPEVAALVLSSRSFPHHLRIFLDIEILTTQTRNRSNCCVTVDV